MSQASWRISNRCRPRVCGIAPCVTQTWGEGNVNSI
jgi:hypothetical protein